MSDQHTNPPRENLLARALLVAALGAGPAMLGVAWLNQARVYRNTTAAAGALRTLAAAQTLFRESDKEGDDELDYAGSTWPLGQTGLIDEVLAGGVKQGYVFAVTRAAGEDGAYVWGATAHPAVPGVTGDLAFFVDWRGEVRWVDALAPIPIDPVRCEAGIPLDGPKESAGR